VVVGDQSSGKSSLLEGLTELPFPVAGQLCTRFATQVSFRRSALAVEDSITVTVIPAPDSDDAYKQKLGGFEAVFTDFTQEAFMVILDDVSFV
jgi:GTPase SAR1 family protein